MPRSFTVRLAYVVALVFAMLGTLFAREPAHAAGPKAAVGNILALTFYLPLRDEAGAEAAAAAMQTPGNARYHQYLSVAQFVDRYGATDNQIQNLEVTLENLGFTIQYVYPNHLAVEAVSEASNAERVFGVTLKPFTLNGRAGFASSTPARLPAVLTGLIRGVGGLDTITRPQPRHVAVPNIRQRSSRPAAGRLAGGTPGNYLPADFAKFFDVSPIYNSGVTGRGSTIGIVTLADFYTSDAYSFWKQIGLNVSQSRITKIDVDGGTDPSVQVRGNDIESDLDVEQSGAIAPDAKLRVYIAPNIGNAFFINAFEAAASENLADTISTSWGEAEGDYFYNVATKTTGDSFLLQVFHDVFLELALQGQTLFAASGDSGSFDTVDECPVYGKPTPKAPTCNAPFAVDQPANDPLVTASGGTTLPLSYAFSFPPTVKLSVAHQQAWSWRYIAAEAAAQGHGPQLPLSDWFSVGDGGGVSSYWAAPWYQLGVSGITLTKPGQYLTQNTGAGNVLQYAFPANFHGRNMPDISTNADPFTGYWVDTEGQDVSGYGGTSFAAPQLNGVTALYVQALHGRVGQLNPALYRLKNVTTTDIDHGDNWGYPANGGYDNAAGWGALDAAKLLYGLELLAKPH